MSENKYKLNLPDTDFPMRGNLASALSFHWARGPMGPLGAVMNGRFP